MNKDSPRVLTITNFSFFLSLVRQLVKTLSEIVQYQSSAPAVLEGPLDRVHQN